MEKKNGFNLAEVLITLGIIGLLASIMIVNVIPAVQEAQYKQMWKKEFSVINQAYNQVKQDEGGDMSTWFDRGVGGSGFYNFEYFNAMSNYFSTLYKCISPGCNIFYSTNTNIEDGSYKAMSGGTISKQNLIYGNFIIKNGAHYFARSYDATYITIWVDVNGYNKKPNILGKDLFGVIITKDKVMPFGAKGTNLENTCNTNVFNYSSFGIHTSDMAGAGCSAEYLYK